MEKCFFGLNRIDQEGGCLGFRVTGCRSVCWILSAEVSVHPYIYFVCVSVM